MSDEIQIRRRRQAHFAMVPHQIAKDPSISDKAMRLWLVLQCYADWQEGTARPTVATLADHMACHRATVHRARDELVAKGLLEVESRKLVGKPNLYTVIEPKGDAPMQHPGSRTDAAPGDAPMRDGGDAPMRDKQEPGEQDPHNDTNPSRAVAARALAERAFDEVWKRYPRKLNRKGAEKAFVARLKEGAALGDLTRATDNYAASRRGETPAFTMHGATFYGPSQRWRDYLDGEDGAGAGLEPRGPKPRDPLRRGGPKLTELVAQAAAGEHQPPRALEAAQ